VEQNNTTKGYGHTLTLVGQCCSGHVSVRSVRYTDLAASSRLIRFRQVLKNTPVETFLGESVEARTENVHFYGRRLYVQAN